MSGMDKTVNCVLELKEANKQQESYNFNVKRRIIWYWDIREALQAFKEIFTLLDNVLFFSRQEWEVDLEQATKQEPRTLKFHDPEEA